MGGGVQPAAGGQEKKEERGKKRTGRGREKGRDESRPYNTEGG